MRRNHCFSLRLGQRTALWLSLFCAGCMVAQSRPPRSSANVPPAAVSSSPVNEEALAATREQLFKLLRMSPKLTGVVARDPSLLSDQEYVNRNNPELAQFLQNHPEVVRNPEFYLFANLPNIKRGSRDFRLEAAVWPEFGAGQDIEPARVHLARELVPFLVFVCILSALLWVLRVLLENRRWGRHFKVQTEIYSKLLDKFSSNEELLNYVRTESGRRFLESAAIPLGIEPRTYAGSPVARVLTPLQLGVVVAMVGAGFLHLQSSFKDEPTLVVLGTLALMLGIGFILSAALAWLLAKHFDLLPQKASAQTANGQRDEPHQL